MKSPLSHRLSGTQQALFCAVLAAGFCLSPLPAALGQMGPMPPDPAAKKSAATPAEVTGKIKDSFKKLFTPQNNNEDTTSPEDQNTDSSNATDAGAPQKPKPGAMPKRPPLIAEPSEPNASIDDPQVDQQNPPIVKVRLIDPGNPLGLTDATNRLDNVDKLISHNRLEEARSVLPPLQQWLMDSTEAHISLYKTLNKLSSARAQAELERQLALEFALLRDRAIFLNGKISVATKDYKQAVKQLIQVVQSQPKSKIGLQAYEILQDIGFTEKLHLAE